MSAQLAPNDYQLPLNSQVLHTEPALKSNQVNHKGIQSLDNYGYFEDSSDEENDEYFNSYDKNDLLSPPIGQDTQKLIQEFKKQPHLMAQTNEIRAVGRSQERIDVLSREFTMGQPMSTKNSNLPEYGQNGQDFTSNNNYTQSLYHNTTHQFSSHEQTQNHNQRVAGNSIQDKENTNRQHFKSFRDDYTSSPGSEIYKIRIKG
eukprot:403334142